MKTSPTAVPAMLTIIANESKTATEFAKRAEALNASYARPLTDAQLMASFIPLYQQRTDASRSATIAHLRELISKARFDRLKATKTLWNTLVNNVGREVES